MEKYPQDREIIVKSVIGDNNKYIESGANTLAKYGYTSETSYLIDKSENKVKIEKITEDRYKHDAAVVGYLLEKYPQDREIIVKSVIGDNNKYIESGANTLAKYGYTSETSYLIDKSENKVKMMIIFFVFSFAVFSIIILVIVIKAMGYVLKIFESMYSKMKNIFNTVDNIKHSNTLNKNDNKSDNALQKRENIENDSVDLNKYNENLLCR